MVYIIYFASYTYFLHTELLLLNKKTKTKLHGLSPRANYTDRSTAACRQSDCQLLRRKGATWTDPYDRFLGFLDRIRYFSIK
jgi:hypothetical protein